MAPPNLLGNESNMYSAEPVQIISKPGLEQSVQPLRVRKTDVRSTQPQYRWQIVWRNVLIFIYLHVAALYGVYYYFFVAQGKTQLWGYSVAFVSSLGITVGAHRLWAHRTFKAKFQFRLMLAIWQTIALQNDIYEWVRDHRVHHKFTDSDADPHNSTRGFFFSHMGWLIVKKHKDVFTKGKTIDMSDVEADPIVKFQRKYYIILAPLFSFIIPSVVPWYFWNESFTVSWNTCAMFRYVLVLHGTWLVNSAAHIWGAKPYEKNMNATENPSVAFIAFGEGWHNYHHVFPWDYKAAELGNYRLNFSTLFLDCMAKIGWAYDLKTVSVDMIKKRVKRTGDGSRKFDDDDNEGNNIDHHHHNHGDHLWGWGDLDMKQDDINMAEIHHPIVEKIY